MPVEEWDLAKGTRFKIQDFIGITVQANSLTKNNGTGNTKAHTHKKKTPEYSIIDTLDNI